MSGVPNNFQTMVSTGLAISLGATLMIVLGPNSATAYPSGAVSYGGNPVWSVGGTVSNGSSVAAITAPNGQDVVITDVVISGSSSNNGNYVCGIDVTLLNGAGDNIGSFRGGGNRYSGSLDGQTVSFESGIRVSAGDSVTVTGANTGFSYNCTSGLTYTLSGYYAEP